MKEKVLDKIKGREDLYVVSLSFLFYPVKLGLSWLYIF